MAFKTGIDQDALIDMYAQASSKQAAALRQAVARATLQALQGRELTLANVRKVAKTVTEAASTGIAQQGGKPVEAEALLNSAIDGIDAALLKAVEANRRALEQFMTQGVDLQQGGMKSALSNLEKLEDAFFSGVTKAAQGAGASLEGPWKQVLKTIKVEGSDTGARATETVEKLIAQSQSSLRDGRAIGLRAGQALLDSYAALVSGVLIGMSEGLQQGSKPASKKR